MSRERFKFDEIQWSGRSFVHNLFRIYEYVFGRKNGVRCENRTISWYDELGRLHVQREFYTVESFLVFIEQLPIIVFQNYRRWHEAFITEIHLKPHLLQKGAIAFDAVTANSGTGQNISFSHTTAGSNRGILACVGNSTAGTTGSSNTYAGVALTQEITSSTNGRGEIWSLEAPATGSNTLAFNWSAAPSESRQTQVAISYTGVEQSDMIGATASGGGTSSTPSTDITTGVNNSMVVDSLFIATEDAVTVAPDASQTERWDYDPVFPGAGSEEAKATAGVVTMSWSLSGSYSYNHVIVEVLVVAANSASSSVSSSRSSSISSSPSSSVSSSPSSSPSSSRSSSPSSSVSPSSSISSSTSSSPSSSPSPSAPIGIILGRNNDTGVILGVRLSKSTGGIMGKNNDTDIVMGVRLRKK